VPEANNDGAIDLYDVEYLLKNERNVLTLLAGNGDFRSAECIALMDDCARGEVNSLTFGVHSTS